MDLRHLKLSSIIGKSVTVGAFPKDIIIEKGIKCYLKMSQYDVARRVYGYESVSEVIVSRLAKILGIPCIECKLIYALVQKDGVTFNTYICMSKDFNTKGYDTLPFEDFYAIKRNNINESPLSICVRYGFSDYIAKIFILDFIINNLDRHGANVELLVTPKGYVLTSLFDNGCSLYGTREESNLDKGYNINMAVNNFIGSRNLLENVKAIPIKVTIGILEDRHKKILFYGLGKAISKQRKEKIWLLIKERYAYVRNLPFIEVS
ncbi:hypothetical protein D3C81_11070 [compost metagenome]